MSRDFPEQRIHLGAYGFCRDSAGRLLLARAFRGPDHGAWTLPGGGIQWGEDPRNAVMREMEEETGLVDLKIISIAAIYSHIYHPVQDDPLSNLHHVGIIYHLDLDSYDLKNEIDGTTDLCQWFMEGEALALPLTPLGKFSVNLAWPPDDK